MKEFDAIYQPGGTVAPRNLYKVPVGKLQDKYPGICVDAEALGVNRIHLYLVLEGHRKSRSLLERYNKLKKKRANNEKIRSYRAD